MRSKYSLDTKDCCYIYVSKELKKKITKHKNKLQLEENRKKGRKAQTITFSFASKHFAKNGGKNKWL